MKLLLKSVFAISVLMYLSTLTIKDNGKSLLSRVSDTLFTDSVFSKYLKNNEHDSFKAYKWIDHKGIVHYSDHNNSGFDKNPIRLKPITVLKSHNNHSGSQSPHFDSIAPTDLPGVTTIPLEKIPTLIKDAKNIGTLLENRKQQQDKIIDQF